MYSLIITDYKSMSDTVDYIKNFIDIRKKGFHGVPHIGKRGDKK